MKFDPLRFWPPTQERLSILTFRSFPCDNGCPGHVEMEVSANFDSAGLACEMDHPAQTRWRCLIELCVYVFFSAGEL